MNGMRCHAGRSRAAAVMHPDVSWGRFRPATLEVIDATAERNLQQVSRGIELHGSEGDG